MNAKRHNLSWVLPIILMCGMMVVLVLEAIDPDLLPIEPGIEIATLILGFTLLGVWLNANRGLIQDDECQEYEVLEIDSVNLPYSKN